ncbi:MAG: type IX secretion system sortase PorU [Tannerellaceae bacterium]|nr:type IX secretion system sortase PorU [Tannerellaceae bacterium]MCD8263777.1 type IX secretion system sortase PorU [Tannerellaceae bacterium]
MFRLFCVLLSLLLLPVTGRANGDRYAANSVLAEGKWVKIRVDDTGICKITYTELQKMGFSDPSRVAVYGYGGWIQDESFTGYSEKYIDDLPQLPAWKGSDYLLFYARGPRKWEYVQSAGTYLAEHTNNPYSDYGYYLLSDAGGSKEMATSSAVSQASPQQIFTTFDDYVCHEQDLVSVNESGRELFGEAFSSNLLQYFNFTIPGITTDEGRMGFRFISRPSSGTGEAALSIGSQDALKLSFQTVSDSYVTGVARKDSKQWLPDGNEQVTAQLVYNQFGHTNARLDYIWLQVKRALQPYGSYTFFRALGSLNAISRFTVRNATANTMIWDVTTGTDPQLLPSSLSGTELTFTIPAGSELREFVIVEPTQSSFLKYEMVGEIENQNLHMLAQTDMVIVCPAAFVSHATRLAEAHKATGRLDVIHVVTQDQIFNEFSSGTPDATAIRKFMKMFYDRSSSGGKAPRYLLLFGDGAFDNRLITSEWANISATNMLLTYQTQESLNSSSYTYDLYYGTLEDGTGNYLYRENINVGVGRLPVRTVTQAKNVVDKLIAYMNNENAGVWKNKVVFMSDDETKTGENFMSNSESMAARIETDYPQYLVKKIYYDAYKKDFSGLATYPDVKTEFQKQLKEGVFFFNYMGHGDTQSLSDEKILVAADISQFSYKYLPVWVTATCDFTRFDAVSTSAGEQVLLHPTSGGIALFTTARVAYAGPNFTFNDALVRSLFAKDETGKYPALGDVIREACSAVTDYRMYRLGFVLVGDPALVLNYPEYTMEVTAINGVTVDNGTDITFKALEHVTIEGEVYTPAGSFASDFSGEINATVMDSKVTLETLDNNDFGAFTYEDYTGILYTGNETVENGKFSFTFTVPKDISYSDSIGKLNLYALDAAGREANGSFLGYRVGGTATGVEEDNEGPEIRQLYLNDSTFVEGGQVNTTPFFYARVWDQSGINITGNSLGHDITLSIDNWPYTTYTLNSYFETVSGSDGEGIIRYSIPALDPGIHTAEFQIWDVMNNSTTTTFTFEVVEGLKPFLAEINATPNPAREQVEFSLYHNRPESRMKVTIMVYDMTGRLQWKHEESGSSEYFDAYKVTWDLRSNGGGRLRPGVYIYRAAISTDNSKEATAARKLIILTQ